MVVPLAVILRGLWKTAAQLVLLPITVSAIPLQSLLCTVSTPQLCWSSVTPILSIPAIQAWERVYLILIKSGKSWSRRVTAAALVVINRQIHRSMMAFQSADCAEK